MADLAPDLINPHDPGPECGDLHCCYHHVDEPADGAYRVCGECFHVYPTAETLREAWAVTAEGYGLPPGTDVIAPPAEQIYGCPYCVHDW